jgi:hypothetical protein
MKLPQLPNADRYSGLYIVDFGDHCGVGFLAEEVAELLESEQYQDIQIYKIHNAYPDGRIELVGVRNDIFQMEAVMFFHASNEESAGQDFRRLADCAVHADPPARAKIHLARFAPDSYVTALIYPAEFDDQFSRWLLDCDYRTAGAAEGGTAAVERYYLHRPEILDKKQIFNSRSVALSGENLTLAAKRAIVR